ncbi:hypothetical protein GDO81_017519 [Engystomops pustulosus]|uniref:Uncharacterized protein n=1 Tax=Engystomops pustulosus TaxID=76066 RepID=A0AAV7AKK1_ENGPU|nr:hypothetical protein GDO81_017519 [Engystomops pustulosus]
MYNSPVSLPPSAFPCSHHAALCMYTQLPLSLGRPHGVSHCIFLSQSVITDRDRKRGGSRISHTSPATAPPTQQCSQIKTKKHGESAHSTKVNSRTAKLLDG